LQPARARVLIEFVLKRFANHPDLVFDPRCLDSSTSREAAGPYMSASQAPSRSE
jgi:hypothetical protein